MTKADYDIIVAILSVRRLDAAATTTILLPESNPSTPYFPKTPWGFQDTLFASVTTERLTAMAGGLPQRIVNFLRRDIPMCDIPSLLRQLNYTLLEHQTWALCKAAQPIRDHTPSNARPRCPTGSPQKAPPKPLRKKKRKRRSKEDTWNLHREFWKRSMFFFTRKPPQATEVRRSNITRRREEAASPPNARKRRRYDAGGDDGEG
jgi:hypothetical protein